MGACETTPGPNPVIAPTAAALHPPCLVPEAESVAGRMDVLAEPTVLLYHRVLS